MAPTCRLIARSTIPCLSFLVFFILLVDELADGSIILSNSWSVPHSLAAVDIFGILVLVNRRVLIFGWPIIFCVPDLYNSRFLKLGQSGINFWFLNGQAHSLFFFIKSELPHANNVKKRVIQEDRHADRR